MIQLKSRREIEKMRAANQLVAEAHRIVESMVKPGVTTLEIDHAVESFFGEHKAKPLFKGVPGTVPFPAVCCISVNDEVVHGIPNERPLEEGDIVSVDTGCKLNGWCGDSAWTYPVGSIDDEAQRILDVGERVLWLAIELFGEKKYWSEVAREMELLIAEQGYSLVENFVGHGIGREMHEEPQVPNFVDHEHKHQDFELVPGLVLAIEPMVNAGTKEVGLCDDHWTVMTEDSALSVHFEHTVALTPNGPDILSLHPSMPNPIAAKSLSSSS